MMVFDLRCAGGHVFEAWFASSSAWEEQRAAGQVSCPICDDRTVDKAAMAPAVPAKGNRRATGSLPATVKAALQALAAGQARALAHSTWVGPAFADRARAMHAGEEDHAVIHGQATLADARALVEEGIAVAPLLVPIVPPEQLN